MRLHFRPIKDLTKWHSWFAWRPVWITATDGWRSIVWLEQIQRKLQYHYDGPTAFYRQE